MEDFDLWDKVIGETEGNACGVLDLLDPGSTRSGKVPKDIWGNFAFSFSRTELMSPVIRWYGLFSNVRVRQSGRWLVLVIRHLA